LRNWLFTKQEFPGLKSEIFFQRDLHLILNGDETMLGGAGQFVSVTKCLFIAERPQRRFDTNQFY
jgi:hypothetical protein